MSAPWCPHRVPLPCQTAAAAHHPRPGWPPGAVPGQSPRETVSLYAAPLRAGWHLAPPSAGACARTEGARLGRRALGFSPFLAGCVSLPPSSSQLTAARRKMGRPRARTHPAHTHIHTHTHTRTLAPTRQSSINRKAHNQSQTPPRPPPTPPPRPRLPTTTRPPLPLRAGLQFQRWNIRERAGAAGEWGAHSSTCHVRTFASCTHPHTQTHTHTHTEDAHTWTQAPGTHNRSCWSRVGGGDLLLKPGPSSPGDSPAFPKAETALGPHQTCFFSSW